MHIRTEALPSSVDVKPKYTSPKTDLLQAAAAVPGQQQEGLQPPQKSLETAQQASRRSMDVPQQASRMSLEGVRPGSGRVLGPAAASPSEDAAAARPVRDPLAGPAPPATVPEADHVAAAAALPGFRNRPRATVRS